MTMERMLEAIRKGKVSSEMEWCEAVLSSTDPRALDKKGWALMYKVRLLTERKTGLDWWERLRDKESVGVTLSYHQSWAWKEAEKRATGSKDRLDSE